jgi:hypothetical protein
MDSLWAVIGSKRYKGRVSLSKVLGFRCENPSFQTGPLSPATIEQVKETPGVLDGVSAQRGPDREEDIR